MKVEYTRRINSRVFSLLRSYLREVCTYFLSTHPLTLLQNTECNICLNKTEYFRSKTGNSRSKTKLSSTRLVGLKIVLKLRNLEISFIVAESKSIVISSLNFQTCTKITNMLFMSRTLLLHFSILT